MNISRTLATLAALLALVVFFLPDPAGAPAGTMRVAAIVIITIGLLATVALPEYLTVLIFFFLCLVIAIAPANVVFSGFFSGAVWLVFGGMIMGVAIEATGLANRVASYIERGFAHSYFRVIFGTVLIMFLVAFLMPSSVGRVAIMLPIVMALADRLGFGPDSNGRAGLILAVGLGTLIPTFSILPASVPNVAMAGGAEAIYGIIFSYAEYLFLHVPVIGIVSALMLPVFIVVLFPDKISAEPSPVEKRPLGPGEGRLLVVLSIALAFWATDTLHGVSPAWVALGAGIVCALPGSGIMPPGPLMKKMDFGPFLVLSGVIGVGAVVTHTGLGATLGGWLIQTVGLEQGNGYSTFATVVGLGVVLELVTTLPGQPAIMTAFADTLAQATGWSIREVLMAQVPAWALLMFPYQAPPLVATRAISGLAVSKFLRLMIPFALFGWLVMLPLQYFWWRFMGLLQ